MGQQVLTIAEKSQVFSGLVVDIDGASLLLPVAAVAEAVRQVTPKPSSGQPEWMYGWLHWREQYVPMLSYEKMLGLDKTPLPWHANALVINSICNEDEKLPFYALFVPVLPRSFAIRQEDELQSLENVGSRFEGLPSLLRFVRADEQFIVPDFAEIERRCRDEIPELRG